MRVSVNLKIHVSPVVFCIHHKWNCFGFQWNSNKPPLRLLKAMTVPLNINFLATDMTIVGFCYSILSERIFVLHLQMHELIDHFPLLSVGGNHAK
jgi:hypothetical protein